MGVTLVSVSRITKAGSSVSFHSGECRVFNPDGKRVATIPLVRGLYRISAPGGETASPAVEGEKTAEGNSSETRAVTLDEAHRMLGHVSYNVAREAITNGLIEGVTLIPGSTPTTCDACERGKMSRKAISKERVRPRATEVGGEIHSDVWGPASTETLGHRRYKSLFIDD
ncbi:hypothetical protein BD309DRAFT_821537, partial [Dichomitus squalens]